MSPPRLYESAVDMLLASPPGLRRLAVNAGALGRSVFRGGLTPRDGINHNPRQLRRRAEELRRMQSQRLAALVAAAGATVPHYRHSLPDIHIETISDIKALPVLTRETLRAAPRDLVARGVPGWLLQRRVTSGSTGSPLVYYHHRETLAHNLAAWQAALRWYGWNPREPHAHFGGLPLVAATATTPPYWQWVDVWRQLRCSAYHLSPNTYRQYLAEMRRRGVRFGLGYASGWHQLALLVRDNGGAPPLLRAIVTDSDGLEDEQKAVIEDVFGCPVFRTYGCGETGMAMLECSRGRYHEASTSKLVEIVDDNGNPAPLGATGRVLVTDLLSHKTPYIRYDTGDLAVPARCDCGWNSPAVARIEGRTDEALVTPSGRRLTRLSHIIKPAAGVLESQIVQTAPDNLEIRVIAAASFDPDRMDQVCARARRYVGDDMRVVWKQVETLPRLPNGKLRHVVREG